MIVKRELQRMTAGAMSREELVGAEIVTIIVSFLLGMYTYSFFAPEPVFKWVAYPINVCHDAFIDECTEDGGTYNVHKKWVTSGPENRSMNVAFCEYGARKVYQSIIK